MNDLKLIESDTLTIDTPEKFLDVKMRIDFAKGFIKAVEALWDEKALEIVAKFGPIYNGDWVYDARTDATYKPRKTSREMAQGIMETLGGDWDAFALCLASGAFKHGQLRKLLEEAGIADKFDAFFERVEKKTVEGKPIKKVKAINTAFCG